MDLPSTLFFYLTDSNCFAFGTHEKKNGVKRNGQTITCMYTVCNLWLYVVNGTVCVCGSYEQPIDVRNVFEMFKAIISWINFAGSFSLPLFVCVSDPQYT